MNLVQTIRVASTLGTLNKIVIGLADAIDNCSEAAYIASLTSRQKLTLGGHLDSMSAGANEYDQHALVSEIEEMIDALGY